MVNLEHITNVSNCDQTFVPRPGHNTGRWISISLVVRPDLSAFLVSVGIGAALLALMVWVERRATKQG